jgi:hypothetical protein
MSFPVEKRSHDMFEDALMENAVYVCALREILTITEKQYPHEDDLADIHKIVKEALDG